MGEKKSECLRRLESWEVGTGSFELLDKMSPVPCARFLTLTVQGSMVVNCEEAGSKQVATWGSSSVLAVSYGK